MVKRSALLSMTKTGHPHRMASFVSLPGCDPTRSILAWVLNPRMRPVPNLLQHDNVLCIVIEFDTRRVLDTDKGSLFGVISETLPLSRSFAGWPATPASRLGRPPRANQRSPELRCRAS